MLIIFDLDGTLFNTIYSISKCINNVLAKYELKTFEANDIKRFVGNGAKLLLKRAIAFQEAEIDEQTFNKMYIDLEYEFRVNYDYQVCLYEGIKETLCKLEKDGHKFAIYTNKIDEAAKKLCKKLLKDFEILEVIGDDSKHKIKPDSYGIDYISKKYKINKDEIYFVGDSVVDYNTGKNAGVKTFICKWGFGKYGNKNEKSEFIDISIKDYGNAFYIEKNMMLEKPNDLLNKLYD